MHPSRVMILIGIAIGAAGAPSVAEEPATAPHGAMPMQEQGLDQSLVDSELLARSFNNCPSDSRSVPASLAFFLWVTLARVKPFFTVSALIANQLGLGSFVWKLT
jgi:hypothetical protein